jgi:hypothetical protein
MKESEKLEYYCIFLDIIDNSAISRMPKPPLTNQIIILKRWFCLLPAGLIYCPARYYKMHIKALKRLG